MVLYCVRVLCPKPPHNLHQEGGWGGKGGRKGEKKNENRSSVLLGAGCYVDSQTPGCAISCKICEVHRSVTPYSEASDRSTCQRSCLYTFGLAEQLSGRQVRLLFSPSTSIAFLLTKLLDSTNVGGLLHALVANHSICSDFKTLQLQLCSRNL